MQKIIQEKSPIKQKILQYLEYKNVSKYEFYKQSGVTRGVLDQDNGITENNIARFIAYAQDVNLEWLLTGRGDMLRHDDSYRQLDVDDADSVVVHEPRTHVAIHTDRRDEGIPLIPISAMAGFLSGEISVMDYECEYYVVPDFKGADFLIRVKGDSMNPEYRPGDVVACRRVPMQDIFFQWNKVYVLDTNQGAIIKRIHKGGDKEHILLISDNKDYLPFELHLKDVYAVSLVIGTIRPE